jgi:hypothetical protein
MAPTPPLIEDPVPNCFQVLQALRELLHLACHRRSRWFAELELDGKIVIYFCCHTASLSEKTAGRQRDSEAKPMSKNFRKKLYVS